MLVILEGKEKDIDDCECLICGVYIEEKQTVNYDDTYGSKPLYFHQKCLDDM